MLWKLGIIPKENELEILENIKILYGEFTEQTINELRILLNNFNKSNRISTKHKSTRIGTRSLFTRKDIILNCYADTIRGKNGTPLEALHRFSSKFLKGIINGIHLLPFFLGIQIEGSLF